MGLGFFFLRATVSSVSGVLGVPVFVLPAMVGLECGDPG